MRLERAQRIEDASQEQPRADRQTSPMAREREKVSTDDMAAIVRNEKKLLERSRASVAGSYQVEDFVPVGRTLKDTAELIRAQEAEDLENSRLGDTDEIARRYMEETLGIKPAREKKEEPKPQGMGAKVLEFFKKITG